jgi:hypothetical protein
MRKFLAPITPIVAVQAPSSAANEMSLVSQIKWEKFANEMRKNLPGYTLLVRQMK